MAKTIVTHINPDLDAIGAVWLLWRFGGNDFKDAGLEFVAAGERLEGEDNNTVHVDTGLGKFDHHQQEKGREHTCATKLVYDWLVQEGRIGERPELRRIVNLINEIDHFGQYFWSEPTADRYLLFLEPVLNGMKMGAYVGSDNELVILGASLLDGLLVVFKTRVEAEKDIKQGVVFKSHWGRSLAVESANSGLIKLAQKQGFKVVARRDPRSGMVRIKAAPIESIDLSPVYKRLKKADSQASWYFHPSKRMILNGSLRNPKMKPSRLTLQQVIEIIKSSRWN